MKFAPKNKKLLEIGDGDKTLLIGGSYYHDWENDKQTVVLWNPVSDPIAIRISVITIEGKDPLNNSLGREHVEAAGKKEKQKVTRVGDRSFYSYTRTSSDKNSENIFFCHVGFRNHVVIASVADDGRKDKKKEYKGTVRDLLESVETISERDVGSQTIFDPKLSDIVDINSRVESVVGKEAYGEPAIYLPAIEHILVSNPSDTYFRQSLGLVLGQYFVETNGDFRWVVVVDEYGRDIALRYKENSVLVFPLTMISKRLETGETIVVTELVDGFLKLVEQVYQNNKRTPK